MRRDVVIALAGGAVIVLASVGLVTGALREGPLDGRLEPVRLDVHVAGTYHAAGPTDVNGLCLQPPCEARTTIDLTFHGLPPVGYDAHLEGNEGDGQRTDVGPLGASGDGFTLRYDAAEDHRDKDALVVTWGSDDVLRILLPGELRATIDSTLDARIITAPGDYHANEIGGVSVSTVVGIAIPGDAAPERQHRAWFQGPGGWIDLGVLESDGSGSALDSRVEQLRLEDQDRLVVYLEPDGATGGAQPAGFPVLSATL